jgi:hypothetical protein
VVERFGAEAVRLGRHVVSAPGRLDLGSPRGVALLAHELMHSGQRLAFKHLPGREPHPPDPEEREARRVEAVVERIFADGWPTPSPLVVRRTAAPEGGPPAVRRRGWDAAPPAPPAPAIPARGQTAPVPPAAEPIDLAALANDLYRMLTARWRADRERATVGTAVVPGT